MCVYSCVVKRIWCHGITLTLMLMLLVCAEEDPVEGWAVLMEINDFPEGYSDLPLGFTDIGRIQDMLIQYGWQKNHMLIKKDNITPEIVEEGILYLGENADKNDICVFYIASHGGYIRRELKWNETFPQLWDSIETEKRLLIVDSCYAASFLPHSSNPYIAIGSVSEEESGWAGTPDEGLPIIGFVFTYYFCQSMSDHVSVEEGFEKTVPKVREYMSQIVYPKFKDQYPPEHYLNLYNPHPVLDDKYPGDFYLTVEHTASFPLSFLLVCAGMFLVLRRKPE